MGYLLVQFEETRRLVVDTVPFDQTTGQIVELLNDGPHQVSLYGPKDFAPEEIEVNLEDTTELTPLEIEFIKTG